MTVPLATVLAAANASVGAIVVETEIALVATPPAPAPALAGSTAIATAMAVAESVNSDDAQNRELPQQQQDKHTTAATAATAEGALRAVMHGRSALQTCTLWSRPRLQL